MRKAYRILYQGGTGEITEKKSRFIANLKPVESEEEALSFIEETRKKHWAARHNCYAWILGKNGDQKRCSDDGEPSQTAGKPMLDVLEGEGIVKICAVVTRYFGGTLLGTGGLVRAYSKAVQEGLKACTVLTIEPARKLSVTADYNGIGKIQYLLGQQEIKILDSEYTDRVELTVLVPDERREKLQADIIEITGGQAELLELEEIYYSIFNKEVLLFPE
ncbi:YigZ family protein [Clostridium sp. Marseille-P2415]|uniref:YigZ family protein n=1 Tax=Clostridium sp. Marseille-P2415 TaxID=1805471 RepID=UPI000988359F|nr:YigZ family protein [Clostridium sp. Marseille-P2415]